MNEKAEKFWQDFLTDTGRDPKLRYSECFHFELTEYWANELLRLVLEGKKKATSSSLWGYELEGDKIPQKGELSIVTDWNGEPRCVIETTDVTVIPFKDITFDLCSREGEDDDLQSWQEGHRAFFTEEGKELGYEFSEEMPVIFQEFNVVYRKDGEE
ncbi:MAG: ASCH domain-containing protein [Oscillospiraceae bacterium]|nr:ASCH domain-containing protein [Oscillospiraceae bacterium]